MALSSHRNLEMRIFYYDADEIFWHPIFWDLECFNQAAVPISEITLFSLRSLYLIKKFSKIGL